jgi:hypothetical protein
MVAQIYLAPYCNPSLNITQSSALLANTLTLFVGLMLVIDYNMEAEAKLAGDTFDTVGRSVISVIIVVVNLTVLAIPFIVTVFATKSDGIQQMVLTCSGNKAKKMESCDTEFNCADPRPTVEILTQPENQQDQALLPLSAGIDSSRSQNVTVADSVIQGTSGLVYTARSQVNVIHRDWA